MKKLDPMKEFNLFLKVALVVSILLVMFSCEADDPYCIANDNEITDIICEPSAASTGICNDDSSDIYYSWPMQAFKVPLGIGDGGDTVYIYAYNRLKFLYTGDLPGTPAVSRCEDDAFGTNTWEVVDSTRAVQHYKELYFDGLLQPTGATLHPDLCGSSCYLYTDNTQPTDMVGDTLWLTFI